MAEEDVESIRPEDYTEKHLKILQLIKSYHDHTGGKCGLTYTSLIRSSGLEISVLRPILFQLRKNGEFHVKQGLNDKLFMYGSIKKR